MPFFRFVTCVCSSLNFWHEITEGLTWTTCLIVVGGSNFVAELCLYALSDARHLKNRHRR